MTTSITNIIALPTGPCQNTGIVSIVITPNVPSYFKVEGVELDNITDVNWYPNDPTSVKFETRNLILINPTAGTFMIKVTDNFLSAVDRAGKISFRLKSGDTMTYPVQTYGPVSYAPLWQSPYNGLNTG